MFDLDHPRFRPLWLRLVVVAVAIGWSLFEFASGAPFWGILFGALGTYAAYKFFLDFNPRDRP